MNARDMQIEFDRLIQLANPEFIITNKVDSDTIFYFLNAAQNRFIKLNYMSLDNLKDTIENLRKNTDTFKALIINKNLETGIDLEDGVNGKRFELPNTSNDMFFFYLRSFSYVSGTYMNIPDKITVGEAQEDNKALVPNKLIIQDEVEKILSSYYNMPILRQPCAVLEADVANKCYMTVYTDSYTKLKGCNLTYIRKPKRFNVIIPTGVTDILDHCELAENVHQDIVELAVDMFLTEGAYRLTGNADNRRATNKQ